MKEKTVKEIISEYMSKIGSKGGKKSKRKLTLKQARDLNKHRWAKWRKDHGKD